MGQRLTSPETEELATLMKAVEEWYQEHQTVITIRKIELTDESNDYLGKLEFEDGNAFFTPAK